MRYDVKEFTTSITHFWVRGRAKTSTLSSYLSAIVATAYWDTIPHLQNYGVIKRNPNYYRDFLHFVCSIRCFVLYLLMIVCHAMTVFHFGTEIAKLQFDDIQRAMHALEVVPFGSFVTPLEFTFIILIT